MECSKTKYLCVFGVLNTRMGRIIEASMLPWLNRHFEVHTVVHDGTQFEYPALSYAQSLSISRNEPVLYLHTKGAVNKPYLSELVRNIWSVEFGAFTDKYFSLVNTPEPTVATQFTGADGLTRYNGFVANPQAYKAIGKIRPSSDRMIYEKLFRSDKVKIIATLLNDITDKNLSKMHDYLTKYKKMDILYVIGQGSRWQNNELRYSLRSIEKNGLNVGRIFIAGYLPVFIDTEKVTYVKCYDKYKHKHHNILSCIEAAIERTDISNDFLYSSDDHFYIKQTNFSDYPYYLRPEPNKLLPEGYAPGEKENSYRSSLIETAQLLKEFKLPTYRFSWHGNTHFNKKLFNEPVMRELRKRSYQCEHGCEPTCMMLNYQYSRKPFDITYRDDLKFQVANSDAQTFLKCTEDRECFSIGDGSLGKYPVQTLKELFPEKSKYEKF